MTQPIKIPRPQPCWEGTAGPEEPLRVLTAQITRQPQRDAQEHFHPVKARLPTGKQHTNHTILMKLGNQVAFIDFTGQLGFGLLVAIIHRESLNKEDTTQFVVSTVHSDGTANSDQLVEEDHIVDLEAWNPVNQLISLARRTEQFKWSYKQANPPVPDILDADINRPVPSPEPHTDTESQPL